MIEQVFGRHAREFARAWMGRECERTDTGIHFPRQRATLEGTYGWQIDDRPWRQQHNVLLDAGMNDLAASLLSSTYTPQISFTSGNQNIGLWGADVVPLATWGDSDLLTIGEFAGGPEGYASAARQTWAAVNVGGGLVSNSGSPASFTIVSASSLAIYGFLLTASTTDPTTAPIAANTLSVVRFTSAPEVVANGVALNVTYGLQLS